MNMRQKPDRISAAKTARSLESLRKLQADLRAGESAQVTRLTPVKQLAGDHRAALAFAGFLLALSKSPRRKEDRVLFERARWEIARQAAHQRRGSLELDRIYGELMDSQSEYKRLKWGKARCIRSKELLLAEHAVRIAFGEPGGYWAYQMAKTFAERYDPSEGNGLNRASRGSVANIVKFWSIYYGIPGAGRK